MVFLDCSLGKTIFQKFVKSDQCWWNKTILNNYFLKRLWFRRIRIDFVIISSKVSGTFFSETQVACYSFYLTTFPSCFFFSSFQTFFFIFFAFSIWNLNEFDIMDDFLHKKIFLPNYIHAIHTEQISYWSNNFGKLKWKQISWADFI